MKYVYLLQSKYDPERFYVGVTTDLKRRFEEHNTGCYPCAHSLQYRPWKLRTYAAFDDPERADRFEQYLKTGIGRVLSKRHL